MSQELLAKFQDILASGSNTAYLALSDEERVLFDKWREEIVL